MNAHTTTVTFDKGAKDFVLDIFSKLIDDEGFITEKDHTRILTPEGREITRDQLCIIKKGSEKFIAGDLTSLMKLSKGEI
jgi:ribosomal protein S19E (S16A)